MYVGGSVSAWRNFDKFILIPVRGLEISGSGIPTGWVNFKRIESKFIGMNIAKEDFRRRDIVEGNNVF